MSAPRMTHSLRAVLVAAALAAAAAGLTACEQQASDQTSFGLLTQLDPPCITPAGGTKMCFEAKNGQLDDVAVGDCIEVRHRPADGAEYGPILSIRPIPKASANGACG